MIAAALVVMGVALTLFGIPAAVLSGRSASRRRAAARQVRAAERAERVRAEQAERREAEDFWRQKPSLAGMSETLQYQARRIRRQTAIEEAARQLQQRDEQFRRRRMSIRDGKEISTGYRLLVLAGLVLFLVVFTLGIVLDFMIFRGLHPTGTWLLPFGFACLAVIGITTGSVIFLGAQRHGLLHEATTPYLKLVVTTGGAMLAIGITFYLIMIAPYRSYPAGEARIKLAQRVLAADQSAVPPTPPQVLAQDQQAIATAKADLAEAQRVDRLAAGAIALVEIPLTEAAVLGGELLALMLAERRQEHARRRHQQAMDLLAADDTHFNAELMRILVTHGHDEDAMLEIRNRVLRLNAPEAHPRQILGPAGAADQAGAAPPGPASNGMGWRPGTPGAAAGGPDLAGAPDGMPMGPVIPRNPEPGRVVTVPEYPRDAEIREDPRPADGGAVLRSAEPGPRLADQPADDFDATA